MKTKKYGFKFVFAMAVAFLYASTLWAYINFLLAYMNGGTYIIPINRYGEATFELIFISILLISTTVICVIGLSRYNKSLV